MGRTELESPSSGRDPARADPAQQAEIPPTNGIDLHAEISSERSGGDLFESVRVGSRVAFLLCDIAGKRPELDPIAAEIQRVFRTESASLFSGVDVNLMESTEMLIHAINQALIAAAAGVRFAPTMIGCYDVQLGIMAYINAGGQTALFHDSEGTRVLPNASMPLGLFTHVPYDASIQAFEPGAILLVVTKGITESMGTKDRSGPEKLIEVLQRSRYESARELCQAVLKSAQESEGHRSSWLPFKRQPLRDDMTALAMARRPT